MVCFVKFSNLHQRTRYITVLFLTTQMSFDLILICHLTKTTFMYKYLLCASLNDNNI